MTTDLESPSSADQFQAHLSVRRTLMTWWLNSIGLDGDVLSSADNPMVSQFLVMLDANLEFSDTRLVEMDTDAVLAACRAQMTQVIAELRAELDGLQREVDLTKNDR